MMTRLITRITPAAFVFRQDYVLPIELAIPM